MPLQTGEMPLREIQRESNGVGPGIEADQAKVVALMKKAKSAVEEGHPRAALEILQKAAKIQKTEKILKRIAKLEAYLAENGSEDEDEEDDNMVHVGKGFYVFKDLYNRLYEYQKESLLWFWRLHRKQKGGILGDDMGLGKTVQVVAFLSGLFDMEQVKNVLIVVPVALVINWEREFKNWAPGIGVHTFHGASKKERERLLERVQRRGGVLMVSYGLVMTCWEQINHYRGNDFVWDYVMLDEGHKIKNPTKTTKAANAIAAKHRFILTGTPIQNNLKELWSLFNFVTHGTLLGTLQTFKSEYDNPITRAREKDATASEKLLGNEMAESLRLLIAPYFLRRTKADVIKNKKEDSEQNDGDSEASGSTRDEESLSPEVLIPSLTRKNDLIVWLSLTETQIQIYKDFISLDRVKELLMTKRSPLAELTILKKICDHPRLLSNRACRQLGLQMSEEGYDENDDPSEMECAANSVHAISEETLFLESGKLQFLVKLLTNLKEEKHRCLVFSQSRKMLDIIEKILTARGFKLMRLDGTITKMSDREDRISRFQRDYSYSVFLLTTQVGGVGLTLTGANRVVIIDPSWNPATDNQAVDRAYRIGQTRSVVIYRLITCGTVEEKIYRRQVFKESLTKQATGGSKNPYRYFTGQQLKELFVLDDPKVSQTQMQLEAMHSSHRKTDTLLDAHIAFLYSAAIFGISDHDLMFSQEAHVEPDQEYEEEGNQYIQQRVQRAQDLVAQESDLTRKLNDHIQRGTEGPGGAKKRYSMNVNRERLQNEWAEKTGEGVINPPLQHVPKHYKPEDRPPPRGANIAVQDLDRTMEELTLDESGASLGEEAEDLAHRSPGYQSDASEASEEEEEEEVVIIDESPPGSGDEEGGGSRPGSVFVVDDDSRPGSRLEDSSRPGSRIEDKAFIGESYLPEDSNRGCSRNATYDDDHVANSKRDQDEEMEDYIDDHSSAGDFQSDREGSRGEEGLEKSADESLELVVGMTPPNRPNGSFQDHCEESSRDMTSFDTGATHGDMADGSGSLISRGKESKYMMPSDTDSYGTMEVSSGQPSDLPYFNATRKLSLGESRSLTFSRQSSQDEEAECRANTIKWENGQCSSQGMRSGSLMGEKRRDQDVSMSAADDVELDSEDDEEGGSYGEVVEVSISSFCCQAGGDVSQDMDVSITAGTTNSNKDHQSGLQTGPVPMFEDEKDSVLDEDNESSERSPHSNLQEDEVGDEESYEDVSMASFSVQTDDMDDQTNVQSTNPEDELNSPLNKNSSLEDQQSPQEELSSTTFAGGRKGPPGGIDLDATSRFLGLTSEESPFLDTSSPVTKARHVRRIISDDEEDDDDESVFERDVGSGSKGRFLDDEGQRRRSDEEKGRRDRQLSAKRKKPSSVLVDDSDEEEEDMRKSSRTTKSSLDTDQSAALQDSMDDFIVGDSDEEQSLDEPSLDKNAIIDESLLDESEESPSEEKEEDEEDEEEEEEEEEVGRKRRKKHVIVSDEDDDDDDDDEGDDDNDDECISKPDEQHLKSGKNSYFIEMEAADGRSASHDTGRVSDEEGETKDSEEHLELQEEEMVEEDEEDEAEDSDDSIVEEEEGDEEEGEEEEEEEEEEESDENGSEDEADLEMREKYKALVKKGMSKISEGDNKGALRAFLQALYIDGSSEQLQLIALKLKKKLESQ